MPCVIFPFEYPVAFMEIGRPQCLGNLCAIAVYALAALIEAATYQYRMRKKFLPEVRR